MSNSRGSMEIMDVLSSIRRLVSEDRRADMARLVAGDDCDRDRRQRRVVNHRSALTSP